MQISSIKDKSYLYNAQKKTSNDSQLDGRKVTIVLPSNSAELNFWNTPLGKGIKGIVAEHLAPKDNAHFRQVCKAFSGSIKFTRAKVSIPKMSKKAAQEQVWNAVDLRKYIFSFLDLKMNLQLRQVCYAFRDLSNLSSIELVVSDISPKLLQLLPKIFFEKIVIYKDISHASPDWDPSLQKCTNVATLNWIRIGTQRIFSFPRNGLLTKLRLCGCKIDAQLIPNCKNLTSLEITDSTIVNWRYLDLKNNKKLKRLNLMDTIFKKDFSIPENENVPATDIAPSTGDLVELYLTYDPTVRELLPNLPKIEELYLYKTRVSDELSSTLSFLKLRQLSITDAPSISLNQLKVLARITTLTELSLLGVGVSDKDVGLDFSRWIGSIRSGGPHSVFYEFESLIYVELIGTKISTEYAKVINRLLSRRQARRLAHMKTAIPLSPRATYWSF